MLNSGLGLLENRRERFETGRGPKRDGRRETRINIHAYLEVATSRHSCVWHSVGSETPTSRARQHRTMATTMQAHSVTATRVATATAGVCRARSRSTRLGSVRHESKRARVALGGFSDGASPRPLGSRARSMSSRGPAPAAALLRASNSSRLSSSIPAPDSDPPSWQTPSCSSSASRCSSRASRGLASSTPGSSARCVRGAALHFPRSRLVPQPRDDLPGNVTITRDDTDTSDRRCTPGAQRRGAAADGVTPHPIPVETRAPLAHRARLRSPRPIPSHA